MSIDVWADSVQTAAVAFGAGAALLALRQVRLSRHGGGGANVVALWNLLQNDVARGRRREMFDAFDRAGPFDPQTWTEAEADAAMHVAQMWSTAGAMAKHDVVPLAVVLDEWGYGITRYWRVSEPVVLAQRVRRGDPHLWRNFEWLARQADDFIARQA